MIKKASSTMKFELSFYHYHIFQSHRIYKTYIYVCFEYIIHIFISNMENTYEMSTLSIHIIILIWYSSISIILVYELLNTLQRTSIKNNTKHQELNIIYICCMLLIRSHF